VESTATELLKLLDLAGLLIDQSQQSLALGSRPVFAYRSGAGDITIDVQGGECLAITGLDAKNIDWTQTATMTVTQSSKLQSPLLLVLEAAIEKPLLLVFGPGRIVFTFVLTPEALATARVVVRGYRLPQEALARLSRLSTHVIA
jgi:hypothetical protein